MAPCASAVRSRARAAWRPAQVLRRLRRLPWAQHEGVVVRAMLASAKGRFTDLPLVASLAAGLSRYHPSLGIALPDALLEEVGVRAGCLLWGF